MAADPACQNRSKGFCRMRTNLILRKRTALSRRMGRLLLRMPPILRDARLRRAPQDEVGGVFVIGARLLQPLPTQSRLRNDQHR